MKPDFFVIDVFVKQEVESETNLEGYKASEKEAYVTYKDVAYKARIYEASVITDEIGREKAIKEWKLLNCDIKANSLIKEIEFNIEIKILGKKQPDYRLGVIKLKNSYDFCCDNFPQLQKNFFGGKFNGQKLRQSLLTENILLSNKELESFLTSLLNE